LEALKFGVESLNRELKKRADEARDCRTALQVLTETKLTFFEENLDFFRIYYSELAKLPGHPAAIALVRDLYAEQASIFANLLRDGIRHREVRSLDVEKTAFAIADVTRGIAIQRLLGTSKTSLREDVEFVLNLTNLVAGYPDFGGGLEVWKP